MVIVGYGVCPQFGGSFGPQGMSGLGYTLGTEPHRDAVPESTLDCSQKTAQSRSPSEDASLYT